MDNSYINILWLCNETAMRSHLIPVDPEEVDLPEVEDGGRGEVVGPVVLAARALVALLPVAVHDRLQDGGERRHADPRPDQHRVLRTEDLRRRRAERTVDEHLNAKRNDVFEVS